MWTDFLRSRYVRSLEQQIAELKAEKAAQRAEIERLQRLLIPGMRQMDREEKAAAIPAWRPSVRVRETSTDQDDTKKGRVERMPPIKSWIQARDQAELLSQKER